MSRGGHNRKPTSLKLVQGTARPSRRRNEPKPRLTAPPCPSWLSREARGEWRRLAPELERLGLLTVLDAVAFASLCESWASWRRCEEIIEHEGAVVPGHRGVMRKHPLLSAANAYQQAVRAFCAEFGLTPASRQRLDVVAEVEDDGEEDLD